MPVIIKRLDTPLPPESSAAQQLVGMIIAGCHEEQNYVPSSAPILEHACRDLQRELLAAQGVWWVAWHGETPVGLVRLGPASGDRHDEGFLTSLYVDEGYRLQGVGRQLVEAALDGAADHGWRRVFVFVAEKNPARAFYTRLGLFRVVDSSLPGYIKLRWSPKGARNRASTFRISAILLLSLGLLGLALLARRACWPQ